MLLTAFKLRSPGCHGHGPDWQEARHDQLPCRKAAHADGALFKSNTLVTIFKLYSTRPSWPWAQFAGSLRRKALLQGRSSWASVYM
jgi:hypothetical protein